MQERNNSQLNMSPSQRVVTESRKAPVSTVTILLEGDSLLARRIIPARFLIQSNTDRQAGDAPCNKGVRKGETHI
jgi:hypothetical protein